MFATEKIHAAVAAFLVRPASPRPVRRPVRVSQALSLLAALAAALTGEGRPVVVATTTHIWPPNRPALSPLRGDGPFFCRDRALPDLAAELLVLFRARPGRALVVGRDLDAATGKVRGLEPRELCALRALLDALRDRRHERKAPDALRALRFGCGLTLSSKPLSQPAADSSPDEGSQVRLQKPGSPPLMGGVARRSRDGGVFQTSHFLYFHREGRF